MALPRDKIDSFIKADVYRVLSKGFSYPDEKNIYEMKSIIEELTSLTHLNQDLHNCLEKILSNIEIKELQKDYSRLFLKGRVPMCESSYSLNFDEVSSVTTFYKAFGLSPKSGDLPDSLPYELEFASILSLKSALAHNEENEEIARAAFKKFLNEHLVEFVKKFSNKAKKAEPNIFYKTITELLKNSVESDMMEYR